MNRLRESPEMMTALAVLLVQALLVITLGLQAQIGPQGVVTPVVHSLIRAGLVGISNNYESKMEN